MKKLTYGILFILIITSCEKPYIDFGNSKSENYEATLDTLRSYENFFIGEFNGELLVSIEPFSIGRSVGNVLQDSVIVDYFYAYKIKNSEKLKTPFISFQKFESVDIFDSSNYHSYNEYNDFYNLFNYSQLEYVEVDDNRKIKTKISIYHVDYSRLINNRGISYSSSDFGKPPNNENDFRIESIKEIENPNKGIELTYSFNCILLSDSNEVIEIKNAKGKCSFIY